MIRRPPRSTRTDTLFPYTTLFRSCLVRSFVRFSIGSETARLRKVTFPTRSEEHTSELQSLMRISYAVFCLKKKNHFIASTTLPYSSCTVTYHFPHTHLLTSYSNNYSTIRLHT